MKSIVEMKNITKVFPGIIALDNVNFELYPGEVHVILGENGAGKSTLVKILSGALEPTNGKIILAENEYSRLTPKESANNGISIIYQELCLVEQLSIGENIFVGKLPSKKLFGINFVDYKMIKTKSIELLNRVGLKKDPLTNVSELSISDKQLVEISKALSADAKIIIMDEPTSSLTDEETENLFKIIKQLKKDGIGIIYISHKLQEIKKIGDRVTVLKDGKYVDTKNVDEVEVNELITMMVGRELVGKYKRVTHAHSGTDRVIFCIKNLSRRDKKVKDISFELYKGEILGFAGMVGSGRTELMNAIFRAVEVDSGEMFMNGKKVNIKNTYQAVKNNIALITENRREYGFFHNFEIWRNISIVPLIKNSLFGGIGGLLNNKKERTIAEIQKDALKIKCSSINQNTVDLSGGNQQKVIIAKWLAAQQNLIIFDEPTKGIDIGAKVEIYNIMRDLANKGKGIIMVSSELPELLSVCDRIVVMRDGKIKAIVSSEEATEENIMKHAAG